ncbi:hypothetical protein FQN49_005517, partial [Arthroderma sp. PD_2]
MPKHTLLSACRSRTVAVSPPATFIKLHSRTLATTSISSQTLSSPVRTIPTYLLPSQRQWRPQRPSPAFLRQPRTPTTAFSTSAVAKATVATLNPQVSEDGEPLLVSISSRAAK